MNDSQHPNVKMKLMKLNGEPHLCIFALRDINKTEEIHYDYGVDDLPWRQEVIIDLRNCSCILIIHPLLLMLVAVW